MLSFACVGIYHDHPSPSLSNIGISLRRMTESRHRGKDNKNGIIFHFFSHTFFFLFWTEYDEVQAAILFFSCFLSLCFSPVAVVVSTESRTHDGGEDENPSETERTTSTCVRSSSIFFWLKKYLRWRISNARGYLVHFSDFPDQQFATPTNIRLQVNTIVHA
jgi:hypothetical protein